MTAAQNDLADPATRLAALWPEPARPDAATADAPRASMQGRTAAWLGHPGRLGRALLDLVYPPGCLACSAPTATPDSLCPACWAAMRFITPPFCDRLGTPFAVDLGPGLLSPQAIADPPVYGRARAVAAFEGPARALVHRLKYGDRPDYARAIGAWMAVAGAALLGDADVIVPVPLHGRRLWGRRFNQAAVLAQAIGRAAARPVDLGGFKRVKPTRAQVGLSRVERAANIQGAFRVEPQAAAQFRGQRLVLVDDVLTTGATVNAAARVLLRAGAGTVDVLVFARVVTGA